MNQLPVTIYKHWAGQVGIALVGIASVLLVFGGLYTTMQVPWADPMVMFAIAVLVLALIGAVTIVWLYQYGLSYIVMTSEGIQVVRWTTLFHSQNTITEWSDVEDVSAVTSGFFAQMLGFGTLNIQTAGTLQNIRMTMTPNADDLRQQASVLADNATP